MTSDEGTRPESAAEADIDASAGSHRQAHDDAATTPSSAVERSIRDELSVFEGLEVPDPIPTAPPTGARLIAFGGILLGGLLGGLIGYGVFDLYFGSSTWAAIGAFIFGVGAAVGLGIVTSLTLRAMNEWREVQHPEALTGRPSSADGAIDNPQAGPPSSDTNPQD